MRLFEKELVRLIVLVLAVVLSVGISQAQKTKFEFQPVEKAELEMKDNSKQPGAHAMILELREVQDNLTHELQVYYRIKVFTAEGKKYGDIEIPYRKEIGTVSDVYARTIHSDGTVIAFQGQILDKKIVKSRNRQYLAKTFALPDVQPGSIIEYQYTKYVGFQFRNIWILQGDLYSKSISIEYRVGASLRNDIYSLYNRCAAVNMPISHPMVNSLNSVKLVINDVPATEDEAYLSSETDFKPYMKCWFTFYEIKNDNRINPEKYWHDYGKSKYEMAEKYIGGGKNYESKLSTLISASDTADLKLHKIYDFVQSLRNISYEKEKTAQEWKQEKIKNIHKLDDVLKKGYGDHADMNLLFVALAKSAGLNAEVVLAASKNEDKFNFNQEDSTQLDYFIARVTLEEKEMFFDPGLKLCPFGILPLDVSGTQALRLTKDAGIWVTTPDIRPEDVIIQRNTTLDFAGDMLRGETEVTYTGQNALDYRLSLMYSDEVEQRSILETEVRDWFSTVTTVKLTKIENLANANLPLIMKFSFEIGGYGASAGSRTLLPVFPFSGENFQAFTHNHRKYPVSFKLLYRILDKIEIKVPSGYKVESIPHGWDTDEPVGKYAMDYSQHDDVIVLERKVDMFKTDYPVEWYPLLRIFFHKVISGDQETVVLHSL